MQTLLQSTTNKAANHYSKDELCPANKNKQKAQTLSNIFKKFYLKQLQPYQSFLTGKIRSSTTTLPCKYGMIINAHYVDSVK